MRVPGKITEGLSAFLSTKYRNQRIELREHKIVCSLPVLPFVGDSSAVEVPHIYPKVYGFLMGVAIGARTEGAWVAELVGEKFRQQLGCTEFWEHADPLRPYVARCAISPVEMDAAAGTILTLECRAVGVATPPALVTFDFLQVLAGDDRRSS